MKPSHKTFPPAQPEPTDRPLRLIDNKSLRAWFYQGLLGALIVLFSYWLYSNVVENLRSQNIATGFGFLHHAAQFEIGEKLIDYTARDSYARAIAVGLLNTLNVTLCGIALATVLGFSIGIARVSRNWLLARLAEGYIELWRNVPVILQVIFWSVVIRRAPPSNSAAWGFSPTAGCRLPCPPPTPAGCGAPPRCSPPCC